VLDFVDSEKAEWKSVQKSGMFQDRKWNLHLTVWIAYVDLTSHPQYTGVSHEVDDDLRVNHFKVRFQRMMSCLHAGDCSLAKASISFRRTSPHTLAITKKARIFKSVL
jgi:ribosomal protein L31